MAISCVVKLENTGLDLEIPVYISVQNVVLRRCFLPALREVTWVCQGTVMVHSNRNAKYNGMTPLETLSAECVFNPDEIDPLTALYRVIKENPRFSEGEDS